MTNQLPPPDKLDLEGWYTTSVGLRWEKWKRSLTVYLEAAYISDSAKKRATLPVLGGAALQNIFFNLPGASEESGENVDVFMSTISKINDRFLPKQNKTYEKHIFLCKFDKPDEHLIDQIIGKCLSSELRKKILWVMKLHLIR